jgi:hypothetical protein
MESEYSLEDTLTTPRGDGFGKYLQRLAFCGISGILGIG